MRRSIAELNVAAFIPASHSLTSRSILSLTLVYLVFKYFRKQSIISFHRRCALICKASYRNRQVIKRPEMDPLSAFSLACGVLQFVDYGCKLISTTKNFYQKGSLEGNDDLERQISHLSALRSALNSNRALNCAGYQDYQELLTLAGECDATAQELLEVLDNLKVSGSHRIWKSLDKSFAMRRRKGTIERLNNKMDSFRKALDTRILVSLR